MMAQETYETLIKLFEQHGRCASANYMVGGMDLFFDVENFHLRNNKLCIEQFDSLLYIPEILSTRQDGDDYFEINFSNSTVLIMFR